MAVNEIELEEQLKKTGNLLLNPPSDSEELINLLDKMESLLVKVEQAPSISMHDAILLPMKALGSTVLLRHSNEDVKVSVASCISEITRITAPDAPYDDDQMKEFFQLTLMAYEKLSLVDTRCYKKALSILDTAANIRSCLIMLDLELDELVAEMCKHFVETISFKHPHSVFCAMETIMTLVIDESEDISMDLLNTLLTSVGKNNQSVSPTARKLGEKVMINCAAKLKPYIKEAVQSLGIAIDDYSPVVASICNLPSPSPNQRLPDGKPQRKSKLKERTGLSPSSLSKGKISSNRVGKEMVAPDGESLKTLSKRRDNSVSRQQKHSKVEVDNCNSLAKLDSKKEIPNKIEEKLLDRSANMELGNVFKNSGTEQTLEKKRINLGSFLDEHAALASLYKRIKLSDRDETDLGNTPKLKVKRQHAPKKEVDPKAPKFGEDLIGCQIKVWWPLDRMFYNGVIDSYYPDKKKHKILYEDGDVEVLNLQKERWELAGDGSLPEEGLRAYIPKTAASLDMLPAGEAEGKVKSASGKKLKSSSSLRSEKSNSRSNGKSLNVVDDGLNKSGGTPNDD